DDHFDDGEPAFVLHCRITLPIELITMESLFPAAPVIRTTVTALSRLKPRGSYWTESRVAARLTLKRLLMLSTAPTVSTFARHCVVTQTVAAEPDVTCKTLRQPRRTATARAMAAWALSASRAARTLVLSKARRLFGTPVSTIIPMRATTVIISMR